MQLTLGFSPCPNDTFMIAALVNHWIDTKGFEFQIFMEDVQTLNEWAAEGKLEITKMSFHRWLSLQDQYHLLQSGAALGRGCGPLIISKEEMRFEDLKNAKVVLPGEHTTAHLLFKRYVPDCEAKSFRIFSEIEENILNKTFDAGVIIHENRFTYEAKGLKKVADLGALWENETGLPIPLGAIFIKTTMPQDIQDQITALISTSIQFAFDNPERVMEYVRQYAQEMNEDVMRQHIDLYVNSFSLDLGPEGNTAIDVMKQSLYPVVS